MKRSKRKSKLHKVLRLHHHKHTGKIIAHKHTSYGALFLLLLAPMFLLSIVGQLQASADSFVVNATVPAPMPGGTPSITSPADGEVLTDSNLLVAGSCPVITPAIIIAVYDNGNLAGSAQCDGGGAFSVSVTVNYGNHSLVATVITITNEVGNSSTPVQVSYSAPPGQPSPSPSPSQSPSPSTGIPPSSSRIDLPEVGQLYLPLGINARNTFIVIGSQGQVTWEGAFTGGRPPYKVIIDWGDGSVDSSTVTDSSDQEFKHNYDTIKSYSVTVEVTDEDDTRMVLHTAAVTALTKQLTSLDQNTAQQVHPVITFIEENAGYIVVSTGSALAVLWFIEHGGHIIASGTGGAGRLRRH